MIGQEIISNLLKQITLEKTLQAIKAVGKGFSGIFGGLFGSADGNVFKNGKIQPFANGGIVNKPTIFPMANGTGLMGEAGPEAIMPLTRKNGKLGVEASGGGTVINIYAVFTININPQVPRGAFFEKTNVPKLQPQLFNRGTDKLCHAVCRVFSCHSSISFYKTKRVGRPTLL